MDTRQPLLECFNICKEFSGKRVVSDVNMTVMPGEVIALIGENGAGKSTLKNMLVGLLTPTKGNIVYEGKERSKMSIGECKIAAVHQELSVFPSLSVAENICITSFPGKGPIVDWKNSRQKAKKYLDIVNAKFDVDTKVEMLGPGECQLVEIAKALYQEPKVLILDEPTASLSQPERVNLFSVMRNLKKQGVGMIFITHFTDEVYEVSDRIVILRNGVHVGGGITSEVPRKTLEELLVGRELHKRKLDIGIPKNEKALVIKDFNSDRFININFDVCKGEILGIAGLMGAGRTEVIESIFGLRKVKGKIELFGKEYSKWTPRMLKDLGMIFVPEDRKNNGIFAKRTIRENITAANLNNLIKRRLPGLGFNGEKYSANRLAAEHHVSHPGIEKLITSLSGGNQQKAIFARWMSIGPKICIFDDPTRGVDIGAKEEISSLISKLAREGCSVVIVSSDIKELIELSHRIIIMQKGKIVAETTRNKFDSMKIISTAARTVKDNPEDNSNG